MNEYLTQVETAELTRLSPRTLERMRLTGTGPKFIKAGRRVIYAQRAIIEWLESNTVKSTSEIQVQK